MTSLATRESNDLAYAQRERFRFIESSLMWEGALQRQRVSDAFGISLNHVTKVLREYDVTYPDSIVYDHRRQSYVCGRRFRPRFASKNPAEYLNLQLAHAESPSVMTASIAVGSAGALVDMVPAPPLGISGAVLRAVIRAIVEKKGLKVLYHSTSAPESGRRQLWPHALVYTGVRWHTRAFDEYRSEFRNFALQRMENAKVADDPSPLPPDRDIDWTAASTLKVVPNPRLAAYQQQLVARDFGMTKTADGPAWLVEVRNCLIGYFAFRYGLDDPKGAPAKRRIVLANEPDVRKWFLPSEE